MTKEGCLSYWGDVHGVWVQGHRAVFPVRRDAREGLKPSTELRKAGVGNGVH